MVVTHGIERFHAPSAGVVLSIGNFDGVHAGIGSSSRRRSPSAGDWARPWSDGFRSHPLQVLAPERAPAPLTTLENG